MTHSRNILYLKRPASTEGQMWKSALPIGDGITGGLIYGAISEETVIVTRHDLWSNRKNIQEFPDISHSLAKTRSLIDNGDYQSANTVFEEELKEFGYLSELPHSFPLGELSIKSKFNTGMFTKYRRGIDMERGYAFVTWNSNGKVHERRAFVSKADGIMYVNVKSEYTGEYEIGFDCCGINVAYDFQIRSKDMVEKILPTVNKRIWENYLLYTADAGGQYGALICVRTNDCGNIYIDNEKQCLVVASKSFTVKVLSFSKPASNQYADELIEKMANSPSFDEALENHSSLYTECFGKTNIEFSNDGNRNYTKSNEELIAQAYEDKPSIVLYERLWRFSRYLFICGTSEYSNPFSLYGLWAGEYNLPWNQIVCNQNIQMIYWHTLTGNLADTMKSVIHYYTRRIPQFRENAQKLFGCGGIYVPAYTTPETMNGDDSASPAPCQSVILNWISGAGWLSYEFYRYYVYTQDKEMFLKEILPFMIETARFYADYVVINKNGKCRIYPSVSPENTPKNLITENKGGEDYVANPVVENATMDFAIMKSLFKNLKNVFECSEFDVDVSDREKQKWFELLNKIPEYQINKDGALKEWMCDSLEDNYFHRHFSHVFPLFPSDEIEPNFRTKLSRAAKKAIELRESNSQSGWSFAHSACIWARLGNGIYALDDIDMLIKSCLLDNFFTTHNDWRHMGVSMYIDHMAAPVQLDALMGCTNAIQEMLLQYRQSEISILPAISKRFGNIKAENLKFPNGVVSISLEGSNLSYTITTDKDMTVKIKTPIKNFAMELTEGRTYVFTELLKNKKGR